MDLEAGDFNGDGYTDLAVLATYIGDYQDKENFLDLNVSLKDETLSGKFEGGAVFALAAIDATTFTRESGNPLRFTFQKEGDKVTGILLKTSAAEMTFKKIDKAIADAVPKLPPVVEPTNKVVTPRNWPQFRGNA